MAVSYKDRICEAMSSLGKDPLVRVIGYNVTPPGGSGGGSFNGIPLEQRIEMPLAEHNMAGVAIGMSLAGFLPILFFERADFLTNACDAIVNHMDKLAVLSDGMHQPACIIRVCVGNREVPLFTEPTHVQDLSNAFRAMLSQDFMIVNIHWAQSIAHDYYVAHQRLHERKSTMLVEYKDRYAQEI